MAHYLTRPCGAGTLSTPSSSRCTHRSSSSHYRACSTLHQKSEIVPINLLLEGSRTCRGCGILQGGRLAGHKVAIFNGQIWARNSLKISRNTHLMKIQPTVDQRGMSSLSPPARYSCDALVPAPCLAKGDSVRVVLGGIRYGNRRPMDEFTLDSKCPGPNLIGTVEK